MKLVKLSLALFVTAALAFAETTPSTKQIHVGAQVALSSLVALTNQHLGSAANSLALLASTPEAQSADWSKIKAPLQKLAELNIDALYWFVLPDGSYWSVQNGKESGNLTDRAYFPKLIQGKRVMGDLVISKATQKAVAIVAVPVLREGKVVGALGASVYLEKLSAMIEAEMGLDKNMIFYSFDDKPILGLVWDPSIIFADPHKLGKEVSDAFDKMKSRNEGTIQYSFRGKSRTVIFKKSDLTGWHYAFGLVPAGGR